MRLGTVAVALVAAVTLAGGALAAVALKDPKSLALRMSDFPPSAKLANENVGRPTTLPTGGTGKGYMAGYTFKNGTRDEEVVITVIATGSAAQARGLFAGLKKEVLKKGKSDASARLPKYGDEQLRVTQYDGRGPNVWATELLVRKNTVVWTLNVGAHPSTSKPFPKAQALAELKKYAAKQKGRAGTG
jgi:hypothetical protein